MRTHFKIFINKYLPFYILILKKNKIKQNRETNKKLSLLFIIIIIVRLKNFHLKSQFKEK